jgi:BCD family chlorophyll transporter-like MFS transporter
MAPPDSATTAPPSTGAHLSWPGIVRLGLVQTSIGAIVVLTTSTMNRIMVIEQALPAMIPGFLVALHYVVQLSRPRIGHASDTSGRRTPWIVGGVGVLGAGACLAAWATAAVGEHPGLALTGAVAAFLLIGIGVGTAGTSLLALLARQVAPGQRAAAGSVVWIMMITGFVVTAGVAGHYLDPYSGERLLLVTGAVAALALAVTALAVAGVERGPPLIASLPAELARQPLPVSFRTALREVAAEPRARIFTVFVFVSMLAYSAQDLILEPFAGAVFGMTPGESTQLAGVQNAGVLAGMLLVAISGSLLKSRSAQVLRLCTAGGCLASAGALFGIAAAGVAGPPWPLGTSVFLLGLANGAFAAAAIALMMALAGAGRANREGVRMGIWGAAQAMAFAVGGFLGTAAIDLMRALVTSPGLAYASVFAAEAMVFLLAAQLARRIDVPEASPALLPRNQTLEASS